VNVVDYVKLYEIDRDTFKNLVEITCGEVAPRNLGVLVYVLAGFG